MDKLPDYWKKLFDQSWLSEAARHELMQDTKGFDHFVKMADGKPTHHRFFLKALAYRSISLVRDMLEKGASARVQSYGEPHANDPNDNSEFMPLSVACEASPYPYNPALVDLLLAAGADPYEPIRRDHLNKSPVAAAIDDIHALRDLLSRGFHPDMMMSIKEGTQGGYYFSNETALLRASSGYFEKNHSPLYQRRQVIRMLLDAGADINQRHAYTQQTPVLYAVIGFPQALSILIRGGADLNAIDRNGDGIFETLEQLSHYQDRKHLIKPLRDKISLHIRHQLESATQHVEASATSARL